MYKFPSDFLGLYFLSYGGLGESPSRRRHFPISVSLQRDCLFQLKVFSAPLRASAFAFGAFGAVSVTLTRHHKQLSCLTLRVSHRAWIEPGEWLNTKPSTSPRGATPTHAGRWGSAWRTPPDLQTTEATGFSPKPDRLQAGDRIGDWRLAGCPGAKNRYAERPY